MKGISALLKEARELPVFLPCDKQMRTTSNDLDYSVSYDSRLRNIMTFYFFSIMIERKFLSEVCETQEVKRGWHHIPEFASSAIFCSTEYPGSKDGSINLIPPFYLRVNLHHPQFNLEKTSILIDRKDLIINNNQVTIRSLKRDFNCQ